MTVSYQERQFASVLSQANNDFGIRMFREASKEKTKNLFISPFSIFSAMGMVNSGAEGNTAKQILTSLGLNSQKIREGLECHAKNLKTLDTSSGLVAAAFNSLRNVINDAFTINKYDPKTRNYKMIPSGDQLYVVNHYWGEKTFAFNAKFISDLLKYFGGELTESDFRNNYEAILLEVNKWVESQTNEKIKDLFKKGDFTSDTRLVLVSAIYFKGLWANPFDLNSTKSETFTLTNGTEVKTEFMRLSENQSFQHGHTEDCEIVKLPYSSPTIAMRIILPDQGVSVDDILNSDSLELALTANLRNADGQVIMPKFKVESDLDLGAMLEALGMNDMFNAGKADFSGMIDREKDPLAQLAVSKVVHKSFCEVNEVSTEAAAATGIAMFECTSVRMPEPPFVFVADRPFLFTIEETSTNTVLFLGRYSNPV